MAGPRFPGGVILGAQTTDPTAQQGELWYRSDLESHRFETADGGIARVGFQGTLPIVSTGKWHRDGYGSAAQGSAAPVVSRGYAIPIWPGRKCTLTDLAMNIGAAFTTAGNIRAGMYESDPDTGLPADLITDYGTQTATATTRSWTGLSTILYPRLYWTVLAWQGGSAGSPTYSARNIAHPLIAETNAGAPNSNTNMTAYYRDTAFSGAFPDPFGAVTGVIVGPTCTWKLT